MEKATKRLLIQDHFCSPLASVFSQYEKGNRSAFSPELFPFSAYIAVLYHKKNNLSLSLFYPACHQTACDMHLPAIFFWIL